VRKTRLWNNIHQAPRNQKIGKPINFKFYRSKYPTLS